MLKGMKIIVTGAASGIGKAIVIRCLQEGAEVIACDLNSPLLEELKTATASDKLSSCRLDVGSYTEVEHFFTYIQQEHADVAGLVNNAGIYLGRGLLEYTSEDIDRVLDINIKGYVYFSQGFGRLLLDQKRQGVIVNMSSVSGQEGSSDAVYGLTKAAVLGLTKSCAMNFAPYIRVNAVAPTMTNTPMMGHIPEWRQQEYLEHQLTPEPLLAEDIAETAVFLLSSRARAYTGATFDINNGCYLR
ncbi:SDR family oxidoreductase [Paenibacillus sp. MMS20-IR301]|uniref:SDR family NAD(P)-dependent oxidoreductase n=1 Tax=Paenibacillus sp. MMS20-IR301 TaxID=2895946 RepID=UPI0028EBDF7E|nr:SDR family oxidoreductase [Paenibacillus sp. MMS20-IR301]WNS44423.1 SDR family oxidoreductase [Paenibacillus sp. MMS20-IR301]